MSPKTKKVVKLIENIGLAAFAVANAVFGAYVWNEFPYLSISLYFISLICIVRGVSEILEMIKSKQ